jgi:hypothetical protein
MKIRFEGEDTTAKDLAQWFVYLLFGLPAPATDDDSVIDYRHLNTFYEIIDGLINVEQVPVDKRSGDGYVAARKLIHDELSSEHDVEVACYHEAAHWTYSIPVIKLSVGDQRLLKVVGPRIEYYPATNDRPEKYDPIPMGLQSPHIDPRDYSDRLLELLAKVAVAGGESVCQFYGPKEKRGDTNDYGRFCDRHEEFRFCLTRRVVSKDADAYWKQALKDVQDDFRQNQLLIAVKAEKVKQEVFYQVFDLNKSTTL